MCGLKDQQPLQQKHYPNQTGRIITVSLTEESGWKTRTVLQQLKIFFHVVIVYLGMCNNRYSSASK